MSALDKKFDALASYSAFPEHHRTLHSWSNTLRATYQETVLNSINTDIATWVGAAGNWASCLAVLISLWLLRLQVVKLRESLESSSYHQVQNLMIGIDQYFISNMDDWEYFRAGKEIPDAQPLKSRLLVVSEMLLDHFDNIYHQQNTLPKGSYEGFVQYMRDTYRNSPIFREFIAQQKPWYSPGLLMLLQATPFPSPNSPEEAEAIEAAQEVGKNLM